MTRSIDDVDCGKANRHDNQIKSNELMWEFNVSIKITQQVENDKTGEPTQIP